MEKLRKDWVERIFERLECVYKERWRERVSESAKELMIMQWSSGLAGLSANEIKRGIALCECYPYDAPPTVIEFYHYAKGCRRPAPIKPPHYINPARKEVAMGYMNEIKSKLGMRSVPHGTRT